MRTIKKLSFNEVKTANQGQLNHSEMAKLVGGSGGWPNSGTCSYHGKYVGEQATIICNKSKDEIMFWYGSGAEGSYWCCDSCHEASWWQKGCNGDYNTGEGEGSGGPIEIPSGTDPGSGR